MQDRFFRITSVRQHMSDASGYNDCAYEDRSTGIRVSVQLRGYDVAETIRADIEKQLELAVSDIQRMMGQKGLRLVREQFDQAGLGRVELKSRFHMNTAANIYTMEAEAFGESTVQCELRRGGPVTQEQQSEFTAILGRLGGDVIQLARSSAPKSGYEIRGIHNG